MREIDDWVLEQFGPAFADITEQNFYDTFDLLADYPGLGVVRPGMKQRHVRFFHLKPYWIVYQPDIPLLIHRIYHGARDLSQLKLK